LRLGFSAYLDPATDVVGGVDVTGLRFTMGDVRLAGVAGLLLGLHGWGTVIRGTIAAVALHSCARRSTRPSSADAVQIGSYPCR